MMNSVSLSYGVTAVILGLVVGSFLNVVIVRLPVMLEASWRRECRRYLALEAEHEAQERFNLAWPRSHCPCCRAELAWYENVPVLSYVIQRGRCRHCGGRIAWCYPLVEVLAALVSGLQMMIAPDLWAYVLGCCFLWTGIVLAAIDWRTRLLPDGLTLPLLWLGLVVAVLGLGRVDVADAVLGAALGYGVLWGVYWGFWWVTGREGLGLGDLKLLAALSAWLGWQALPSLILVAAVLGVVMGVGLRVVRGVEIGQGFPFGPALVVSGVCAWFLGSGWTQQWW